MKSLVSFFFINSNWKFVKKFEFSLTRSRTKFESCDVSLASNKIVYSYYVKKSMNFDMISYGEETGKLTDIAKQLFKLSKRSFAGQILILDEKVKI